MTDSAVARVLAEQIQTLGTDALNLIVGNWELRSSHHGSTGISYGVQTLRGHHHVGYIHFKRDIDAAAVHFLDLPGTQVPRAKAAATFQAYVQRAGYVQLESVPLLASWEEIPEGFERRFPGGTGISIQALRARSHRFSFPTTVLKATSRVSAFPGRLDPYLDPLAIQVDLEAEGVEAALARVDLWLEREGALLDASTAKEPLNLAPFTNVS